MSVTNGDCGSGTCATPGAAVICLVNGASMPTFGCGIACPSNWQMIGGYLPCSCPDDDFVSVCVPP
jgi:hypothetical protein